MAYIACLIHLILTVVIPLKLTYDAMMKQQGNLRVWAMYWLVYHMIASLQWLIPFLHNIPFNFIFLFILVWLYHDYFNGAQFLMQNVKKFVQNNEMIRQNINLIAEKLAFLNLFQTNPVVSKVKEA